MQIIVAFIILWVGFQSCQDIKQRNEMRKAWEREENAREYKRQVDRSICRQTHPMLRNGCEM